MLRANCDVCGENLFEVPSVKSLGSLPRKLTCLGCGKRFLIQLDELGQLVFYRMHRKKKRALRPIEL